MQMIDLEQFYIDFEHVCSSMYNTLQTYSAKAVHYVNDGE